jgi:hypothetical protein
MPLLDELFKAGGGSVSPIEAIEDDRGVEE